MYFWIFLSHLYHLSCHLLWFIVGSAKSFFKISNIRWLIDTYWLLFRLVILICWLVILSRIRLLITLSKLVLICFKLLTHCFKKYNRCIKLFILKMRTKKITKKNQFSFKIQFQLISFSSDIRLYSKQRNVCDELRWNFITCIWIIIIKIILQFLSSSICLDATFSSLQGILVSDISCHLQIN